MTGFRLIRYFLLFMMLVPQAFAQDEILNSKKYQHCLSRVESDNADGLAFARKWYIEGGGVAAQHCQALALYELDDFKQAALLFETIIDHLISGEGVNEFAYKNRELLKVQIHNLAGLAWKSAGELDKAYNSYSEGIIDLPPKSVLAYDLYVQRGLIQMERDDAKNAVEDFNHVLALNSNKIEGFLYRAIAFRKLNKHLEARLDLNEALALDPKDPEVLFESGINYRMQKKDEKALTQWQKLIKLYPKSHWQRLAQQNIDLIGQ